MTFAKRCLKIDVLTLHKPNCDTTSCWGNQMTMWKLRFPMILLTLRGSAWEVHGKASRSLSTLGMGRVTHPIGAGPRRSPCRAGGGVVEAWTAESSARNVPATRIVEAGSRTTPGRGDWSTMSIHELLTHPPKPRSTLPPPSAQVRKQNPATRTVELPKTPMNRLRWQRTGC